jgi:hypothetical protein
VVEVLKRVLLFVAIGAVVGNAITMIFAPETLAWFQTPGVGSALCNCADVSLATAQSLIRAQLMGMVAGAVLFGAVGELLTRLWIARKQKKKAEQPQPV